MNVKIQKAFDSYFRDKDGTIVLGQWPNLPILLWFGLTVFAKLWPDGYIATVAWWLAHVALLVWAVSEVGWGVNGFRRTLGLIVLGWTLYSIFW